MSSDGRSVVITTYTANCFSTILNILYKPSHSYVGRWDSKLTTASGVYVNSGADEDIAVPGPVFGVLSMHW